MKKILLPKSTSQCDEPHVVMKDSDIIIEYVYEDELISSIVSIKFEIVYSFTYTETEYINTLEYTNGLIEIDNSEIKSSLVDAWKVRNRPVNEAFGGEIAKVKHYRIYFDEYGMYDIICKNIEIEEKSQT